MVKNSVRARQGITTAQPHKWWRPGRLQPAEITELATLSDDAPRNRYERRLHAKAKRKHEFTVSPNASK